MDRLSVTPPGQSAQLTTYGYDSSGNTTDRARPGGVPAETFVYDGEGRVSQVKHGSTVVASFTYDADGNRLIRRENGTTTLYLGHSELKLSGSTVTGTRYYTLGGTSVAVRTGTGLVPVTTLISDHHGTASIALANTTGAVTVRRMDPYGNPRGAAPPWPGDHGFLDKPADTLTGYTRLGARDYDLTIGRFTSLDPVMDLADPQQMHGSPTPTTPRSPRPTPPG